MTIIVDTANLFVVVVLECSCLMTTFYSTNLSCFYLVVVVEVHAFIQLPKTYLLKLLLKEGQMTCCLAFMTLMN